MSSLKATFECKICHCPLSECVILPCGETICRKHTESIDELLCPCKQIHIVPINGFPLNKIVNSLIETNIQNMDMGEKFRAAEESCSKLENSLEFYKNLLHHPSKFVRKFYEENIDKLSNKWEKIKLENDTRCQNLLLELNLSGKFFFSSINNLIGSYLTLAEVNLRPIENNEEFYSSLESKLYLAKNSIDSLIDESYKKLQTEYKHLFEKSLILIENNRLEQLKYSREMEQTLIEHKNFIKDLQILKIDVQVYTSLKKNIDKHCVIANENIRNLKDILLLNKGFDLEQKLFDFPNIKKLDFIKSKNQKSFVLDLKNLDKFEKKTIFGDQFWINGVAFYVGVKLEEDKFGQIHCLGSLHCSNSFHFCGINVEYSMQLIPIMKEPLLKRSCIKYFSPGFFKIASLNVNIKKIKILFLILKN